MKILIILDDKQLEFESNTFSIDYNAYKDYDIVFQFGSFERGIKSVAEGVRVPSSGGILHETFQPVKLSTTLEPTIISLYRRGNNTNVIDKIDEKKHDIIISNQVIETEFFLASVTDSFIHCAQKFFVLEKQVIASSDFIQKYLFIVEEPEVIMNANNSEFKIRETISVVKKKVISHIIVEGKRDEEHE